MVWHYKNGLKNLGGKKTIFIFEKMIEKYLSATFNHGKY
jgi:hypothetical protein